MKRIIVDYEKCDGCKNCSVACMQAHRKDEGDVYTLNLLDPENESRNFIYKDKKEIIVLYFADIVMSQNV